MNTLSKEQQLFHLIKELGKTLRLFQKESVFCEGITFTQFIILDHVAERGSLKLTDLHGLLSVEKSTTTRLVDPIVKQDLLEKVTSKEDPRAIILEITDSGKKIHKKVWDCIFEFMKEIINGIPGEKTNDVIDTLKIFLNAFNNCCQCGCKTNSCR